MKNSNIFRLFNLCFIFTLIFVGNLHGQQGFMHQFDFLNNDSILNYLDNLQMEKYLIRKNHHSPTNRKVIFHSSREFSALCMFDQSCLYNFDNQRSQNAINKVFGYSFGSNHHNNSFRIGWRCKENQIEILAYWYINHKRYNEHLFFVETGKKFFLNVTMELEKIKINYLIEGQQFECKEVLYNPERKRLKHWGYVNYPYFGGKRKTPNDMTIYLRTWISN